MLLFPTALAAQAPPSEDEWTIRRDIEIVSRWPQGQRLGEDRVTADLYRPRRPERVPAAVIINSSGGINGQVEPYYARVLAREGIAALVIDSFLPRGVRRTADDQRRVPQEKSNADAIAGYRWLAAEPWVDPSRIIVLGMSRGGEAAYSAAVEVLRQRLAATDTRFAAHVAITPGSCNFPLREPRTNGAPIFFMLAELDDIHNVHVCMDLIGRMRAAGPSDIRLAIYPGVHHAFEGIGGLGFLEKDWNSRPCAGRYFRDAAGLLYERGTGKRATTGSQTELLLRTCLTFGTTAGGDARVKAQATADLLQFLRDVDVLRDDEARAVVPDCGTVAAGIVRENCRRARNGWTGDLVALARAIWARSKDPADAVRVARLYELAAKRGNSLAQWELALAHLQARGVPRDTERAYELAMTAAAAGDAAAMNIAGVMLRDGVGRAKDDVAAARWFQKSADLRNSYGLTNLARFEWEGRGGIPLDRKAAVTHGRRAILMDENPRAAVELADALVKGDGIPLDEAEAIRLYTLASQQDREPEAKKRAEDALARLRR